ncbi:hypothetical protein [Desulfotomaculum copahuensis]|uniref:Histidine kinase n=1 Tax=Desulfotomaculum copahuensis TaxID=1838280 RepID=A0A1B7LDW0_9FIRM|nr:hypothetical protein [Desulfotomaculum copahuensis]OAT81280.1 hypothetical protein A6M21_00340 [Desulfotomaculum copahuensis]
MGWIIFCALSWGIALAAVPRRHWRTLWPAGLIALATIYAIDSTLISLGAYVYSPHGPAAAGIPVLYLLSGFANGITLTSFNPRRHIYRLPYVMLVAGVFLLAEWVMIRVGYFCYLRWSYWRSFLLDLAGFAFVLWLAEALGVQRGGAPFPERI